MQLPDRTRERVCVEQKRFDIMHLTAAFCEKDKSCQKAFLVIMHVSINWQSLVGKMALVIDRHPVCVSGVILIYQSPVLVDLLQCFY